MTTNNFFSFSRFSQIGCKLVIENKKATIMRVIVMFASIFTLLCWISYINYSNAIDRGGFSHITDICREYNFIAFLILIFAFGIYSASIMMEDLKTKVGKINVLTTPVTPFENWFARWIIHVIIFIAVYIISFFVADLIRVWIFKIAYAGSGLTISTLSLNYIIDQIDLMTSRHPSFMVLAYLTVQSFYILGGSFFPHHSLLRTTIVGFFGLLIFFLGDYIFCREFINGTEIDLGETITRGIMLVLIVFNWTTSYFRFKEMEVIDRL